MKRKRAKMFEKHELFKVVGIFMVIAAILTWVMEIGLYQGGEFVNDEMLRIGVSDFLTYSMFGNYYFPTHFVILVITAGFYKFLGSVPAYQKLTSGIAKKFEKVPALFAIIAMILLAAFAGVAVDFFAAIALIPFFISILSKMGVHKTVGVASTFGGVLIGMLASSYSEKIVGLLVEGDSQVGISGMGIKYGYQTYPVLIIFGISLLLLAFFVWSKCRKQVEEKDALKDPFTSNVLEGMSDKALRRVKVAPIAILMVLFFANIVLGFIPWESRFNITFFKDVFENITSATLFGENIFQYIIGNIMKEFGSWDLLTASVIMIITALIVKVTYSVSFDKLLDEFTEGFKRIVPTVGMLLLIIGIVLFSGAYPTIANFVKGILDQGTDTLYVFAAEVVNALFSPEFSFSLRYTSSAFTSLANIENVALALQTGYGFISFFAPSSLVLMVGLSMLDVKYSEWIKFIWKYIILLLILLIAVLVVL